jgi:hypothetical protein
MMKFRYRILPILLALLCIGLHSPVYGLVRPVGQPGAMPPIAVIRERQMVIVGSQAQKKNGCSSLFQ